MADATTTTTGTAATAAATTAAAAATPWHSTITDADTLAYLGTKGWDKMTGNAAAVAASQAHRELERYTGVPQERLITLPKDAVDPKWDDVYQKLGAPKDAKDYDFSAVKFTDGSELDPKAVDFFRATAAKLHLPKDAAPQLAAAVAAFLEGAEAADAADTTAALAVSRDALAKSWGNNFETNKVIAANAARALGVKPEAITALEGVIGYADVMEMFRTIGTKIGEANFIGGRGADNSGVMTAADAQAAKKALMGDKAWVTRYLAGGVAEGREMTNLNKLIVG